ncbi:MAG: cell division protein FtsZ [Flavobacteriaceae bacterium]|jgi:cell division protein FtsZ|nr:cell division protein FtsZ [Flavobacteriaceae bacterium]
MSTEFEGISFDLPKNQSNVIKVIGVGGGGSNAINHMFQSGINGVDFVVCNTDSQALENSPVPNKIQLGISLTEGLGAGANPEVGEKAAIESQEEVKAMLETNTKMVFITAGMGGGTGTGAAPIIAKHAKDLDILTVGIVTTPFVFEGKMRSDQAQLGIEKLRANVDSLIIINNNKLREVYGNLGFKAGFSKADEVLATAAKGIAEVITHHYTQNIDLRDAKTVLANSGTAIMGSAKASGEGRAQIAIDGALDSPLLNDNKITGAQNVLLLIVSGTCEITIDEIGEINDHIQSQAGHSANIIMGVGEDDSLGEAISVTVIATGFNAEQQNEIVNTETKKIIHTLEDDQKAAVDLSDKNYLSFEAVKDIECEVEEVRSEVEDTSVVRHTLEFEEEVNTASENELIPTSDLIRNMEVSYDRVDAYDPSIMEIDVNDFEIVEAKPQVQEVVLDHQDEEEEQMTMFFDMSIEKSKKDKEPSQQKVQFTLDDEEINWGAVKAMEVIDAVEVTAEPVEVSDVKHYNLDDYMELEQRFEKATATTVTQKQEEARQEEVVTEEELVFETKVVASAPAPSEPAEIDPMESPIKDLLKNRVEERKRTLKDFNHKFNNLNRIDEIEKEPAYKRQGIKLSEIEDETKVSRTSLSSDANDDQQLRSNNSFLHDNVD